VPPPVDAVRGLRPTGWNTPALARGGVGTLALRWNHHVRRSTRNSPPGVLASGASEGFVGILVVLLLEKDIIR
jgi:hypothetical protein